MDAGKCNSLKLWRYSATDLVSDRRVAYFNAKFPWIQAVWMWKNPRNHWPKQFDIGRMAFPTHIGTTGKHVVHWMWRGYRDCIDVDSEPAPHPTHARPGARSLTHMSDCCPPQSPPNSLPCCSFRITSVLPMSLPVANTSGAMYGYKSSTTDAWIRIDHAQVPKGRYTVFKHPTKTHAAMVALCTSSSRARAATRRTSHQPPEKRGD